MDSYSASETDASLADLQKWAALGSGALLVAIAAARRSLPGFLLVTASAPLIYRGVTGRWPAFLAPMLDSDDTRSGLAGDRGMHVREAIQLEKPLAEVYQHWRRLANLPQVMTHLESVTEDGAGRSHWVANGPGGIRVEWDAEIINDVENKVIGWRSLPGSDIVTAGSVNFDEVRGTSTQVTVHLQYSPPAGSAGAFVAGLFGRAPSQTIREDLRRYKQLLEAGEIAQAG